MAIKRQFQQTFFEPMCQVRHSAIVFYDLRTSKCPVKYKEFKSPTYTGQITDGSYKRIRKAIDILLQLSPERTIFHPLLNTTLKHTLSFVTLTIPAGERHITPKEANKLLLEKWLRAMRDKFNMNTYVWKAEYQKNGQLHYHITTPSFIHYQQIRDNWNNILYATGMLDDWHSKHPNKSPNSTDIHAVYKCKDMQSYLTKYLQKNVHGKTLKEQKEIDKTLSDEEIKNNSPGCTGKIWDCSLFLKKAKHFSFSQPSNIDQLIPRHEVKIIPHCGMWFSKTPIKKLPPAIQHQYKQYLSTITDKQLF